MGHIMGMTLLNELGEILLATLLDVAPIAAILLGFQLGVLRKRIVKIRQVLIGSFYVILGLGFFLFGLENALFPLGKVMATQLTDPMFVGGGRPADELAWYDYYWTYLFAFAIGFAAPLAEPALIAVALKAQAVSGGSISAWGLRIAVAVGVAAALAIGSFRIVTGTPLYLYMIAGYVIVVVQTVYAPRMIVPLAYDSGGVTTSTVTVPLVAALGLGLASTVPGRSPLLDGFGMIALAALFPMISVMGYAQIGEWMEKRNLRANAGNGASEGGTSP